MRRLHLFISGSVQGVCYRMYTREKARQLGLTGWGRNLSGARVEAQGQGSDEQLRQWLVLLQEGPYLSAVRGIEQIDISCESQETSFRIVY